MASVEEKKDAAINQLIEEGLAIAANIKLAQRIREARYVAQRIKELRAEIDRLSDVRQDRVNDVFELLDLPRGGDMCMIRGKPFRYQIRGKDVTKKQWDEQLQKTYFVTGVVNQDGAQEPDFQDPPLMKKLKPFMETSNQK